MSTAQVTPESKPVELTLGDGSVVKGANLEEAFNNLKTMKENASGEIRRQKEELQRLQQERDSLALQAQKRPEPEPTNGFSKERYYQLLNDDPIAAQNYMDQVRFGTQDPVGAFNQMRQNIEMFSQQSVIASFHAQHPDFPGTPDAARSLTQRWDALIGSGFPTNVDTLNYAYSQALADGSIKPLETKEPEETLSPNPSLTGAGGVTDNEINRAEQMSDEDLRKFLRSKGMSV